MEQRFEIRGAEARDLLAMSELMEKQLRRYVIKDCTTPEGRRGLLASVMPEALQALLQRGYQYHVAASGADVYGIAGMRDASHLHHLFVADAVRRTGLGRRLWEAARDAVCIHATAPPVFTTVSSLHAVPFFRALGFASSGPEEDRDGVRVQPMRYVLLGRTTR
jgi:GNAT superfamily N-acetyltransferase